MIKMYRYLLCMLLLIELIGCSPQYNSNTNAFNTDSSKMHNLKLFLQSDTDKCTFADDKVEFNVSIKNQNKFLVIINKNLTATTLSNSFEYIIFLNVIHNEEEYQYYDLEGKILIPEKYFLFKGKSKTFSKNIEFKTLTKSKGKINFRKTYNKDFGIYYVQAVWAYKKDTLYSNKIEVKYLK